MRHHDGNKTPAMQLTYKQFLALPQMLHPKQLHEWACVGGVLVDCSTFLLVQSKGAKMVVMNLFRILSPVKLNESILE